MTAAQFPADYYADLPPIPANWEADHWGDDVCPSWIAAARPDGSYVKVWIDHADPAMRERPGARYLVVMYWDDGDVECVPYSGDDWPAVLAAVAQVTGG